MGELSGSCLVGEIASPTNGNAVFAASFSQMQIQYETLFPTIGTLEASLRGRREMLHENFFGSVFKLLAIPPPSAFLFSSLWQKSRAKNVTAQAHSVSQLIWHPIKDGRFMWEP
jgi:hypothetical protein